MRIATASALYLSALTAAGCASNNPPTPNDAITTPAQHAARVGSYLTGSFSSAAQAQADPDNYFDIRLHAVPIWTNVDTAPASERATWLYVEQAAARTLDRPYRQRIYRLAPVTDTALRAQGYVVQSEVFTFPDPLTFAGAWQTPARFDALSPSTLEARAGCTVYLKPTANPNADAPPASAFAYTGSTLGTGCESTLAGAVYATSTVTITPTQIRSWDQGFDAQHNQVWGATDGGYIFNRTDINSDNTTSTN